MTLSWIPPERVTRAENSDTSRREYVVYVRTETDVKYLPNCYSLGKYLDSKYDEDDIYFTVP